MLSRERVDEVFVRFCQHADKQTYEVQFNLKRKCFFFKSYSVIKSLLLLEMNGENF